MLKKKVLIAASLLLTFACRAPDKTVLASDGRVLADMPPIPFRVAIAEVDAQGAVKHAGRTETNYEFSMEYAELQKELVAQLRRRRAASQIIAVPTAQIDTLVGGKADLVIVPRLIEEPYLNRSSSERIAATTGLWLTTWIGGLYVEDRVFDARVVFSFDLVDPHTGTTIGSVSAGSDRTALAYADRHRGSGWLPSLLIPPYWTKDDYATTSRVISERMCNDVAGDLTRYLKERMGDDYRAVLGEIRLSSPADRSRVGSSVKLQGIAVGAKHIDALAVFVNTDKTPVLDLVEEDAMPDLAAQRRGSVYQVPFERTVPLRKGWNRIYIQFSVAGTLSSRTVVVYSS